MLSLSLAGRGPIVEGRGGPCATGFATGDFAWHPGIL